MTETSQQLDLVVHATHEAGIKLGGIGAVLDGLLGSRAYQAQVARTILVGQMSTGDQAEMERLIAPRNRLEIRYSSHHGLDHVVPELAKVLRSIETQYGVQILYGTRAFGSHRHEIILVDAKHADQERTNAFKGDLYRQFRIESDRYEHHPEYTTYVHSAEPGYKALQAIARDSGPRRFLIAHEFMGLPVCYCAMMHAPGTYRTIFYGHEVTTVRPIVEFHSGHDTMFYNVLAQAQKQELYLEDVFGDQTDFFKHGLIRPAAAHCDNIFAVGDSIVQEMRFLGMAWNSANIDLVYNGVPSHEITLQEKTESSERLKQYCANLLGYLPDYVFTHVTRFIPSKGLWRDIRVMEHLEPLLAQQGKSAVLFTLSTIIPTGRPAKAIFEMEARYGWPVNHVESPIQVDGQDVPDLLSHEIPFYRAIEQFNRSARAAKIILINQFGWSRDRCGKRMPEEMTFADIRQGSDLEFGQSIYEPFGIAQVEPLSFGALCVISSVCGCLGFVRRAGGLGLSNVVVADYTQAGALGRGIQKTLSIGQASRDRIEQIQAKAVAHEIARRLPTDEQKAQKLLCDGYALSQKMSWEVVAQEYLIPGLLRAQRQER